MKRDRIHLIQTGIRRICGVLASHPPPRLMRNIEEVGELPIQATNSSVRRPPLATVEDSDDFETLATRHFGSHFSQFLANASTFSLVTGVSGVSSTTRNGSFLKWSLLMRCSTA